MTRQLAQPWKKWYQPNQEYEKPTHFVVPIMAAGNVMPEPSADDQVDLSEPKPERKQEEEKEQR